MKNRTGNRVSRRYFLGLSIPAGLSFISVPLLERCDDSDGENQGMTSNGMIRINRVTEFVGSTLLQRDTLSKEYDCDPSWLNDDLEDRSVTLPGFWIDRYPVTNSQYLAFVNETNARNPWPQGMFLPEHALHPVVGVQYFEAESYARWLGKRLPSAQEWEVAAKEEITNGLNAQNQNLISLNEKYEFNSWDMPGTKPVGSGKYGVSIRGMEDFKSQVCEWTASTVDHHDILFTLVKGASWLHNDLLSYRNASAFFTSAGFFSPSIGFRCALDGHRTPKVIPSALPSNKKKISPSKSITGRPQVFHINSLPGELDHYLLPWSRIFLQGHLSELIPHSRGFVFHIPAIGSYPVCLVLAETLSWNNQRLLSALNTSDPKFQKINVDDDHVFRMEFSPLSVTFSFVIGDDYIDLVSEIRNETDQPGIYETSSCFSLTSHPAFYDCEGLRTYVLTNNNKFVSFRKIGRLGKCIRWIAPSDFSNVGGNPDYGVMATVSRDRMWTFASAKIQKDSQSSVSGNTWLNCFHTEAPVKVEANATRTVKQRLYFIKGGINELQNRLVNDFQLEM